jgi:hypothetical protein
MARAEGDCIMPLKRHKLIMKANTVANWPTLLPESTMIAYNTKPIRQNSGVIKLLAAPEPPDENTIRKLNELAARHPFCSFHKVKGHDIL